MPNRINVLDKNTINRIAAGEVIDRPASIIKELIENSIDAGSKAVSVEIRGGGIELIRITDNGCGIDRDDVRVAFVRHSTSKIKNAEDLSFITSLGFRGEALASIAAVADVELITKTKEAFSAVRFRILGGEELEFEEIGAPDGTTFIIRDIFGCVPVRRKFLKSSATEGSYCNEAVERIALSHPEVSIRYVNNGRNVLYTNGSGKIKDVIFGIYGRDIASEIVELDHTGSKGIKVSGCICKPTIVRNNRNTENTFVNGRFIKSPIIFKAIEDAYQPYLMQHKYPFTSLYLTIDPAYMDVNVHPTKQEVRFENPEAVYNTVFEAVTEVLAGKALIHRAEREAVPKEELKSYGANVPDPVLQPSFEMVKEKESPYITDNAGKGNACIRRADYCESRTSVPDKTVSEGKAPELINTVAERKTFEPVETVGESKTSEPIEKVAESRISEPIEKIEESKTSELIGKATETKTSEPVGKATETKTSEPVETVAESKMSEPAVSVENKAGEPAPKAGEFRQESFFDEARHLENREDFNSVFGKGYRIIGQIFDTYWIVECDGCVYIIDQHAAHEKILYEKFMKSVGTDDSSQLLSPPIIISLSPLEEEIAERYEEELAKNGFVLEHFGGHEYALSEIPLNLYGLSPKDFLLELLDELAVDIKGSVIKSIKEKIATCACKAAVKGNMNMSEAEAKELIKQLLAAENPFNCPHGRPIIIDVTKKEIEKKFKRIL